MNVVVIGANYGDEGKGRTVDFLAKAFWGIEDKPSLNVRFSGSNNAAHTVWKNGKSFVFHMIGAASFYGMPTYLSQHVVVDFVALAKEIAEFEKIAGFKPVVYVDPRCRVNLPYDVMKNRIKEIMKGGDKHGSTGNGLNETIDRHMSYPITAGMFEISKSMLQLTQSSFVRYVKKNLKDTDVGPHKDFIDFLLHESSIEFIYDKVKNIIDEHGQILVVRPDLKNYNCVFEGSQGLALDEYSKFFPHVTRTRTGTTNVIDLCREHEIEIDAVYYVSRTYFSRHGADKYFEEFPAIADHYNIVDETNVPNEWQDGLKFGILNLTEMEERIHADFKVLQYQCPKIKQYRVFTCLDQNIGGAGLYIMNNRLHSSSDFEKSITNVYSIGKLKGINLMFFSNKENV